MNHKVCDTMASASPDLRSPSQPQSVTTVWPVPN